MAGNWSDYYYYKVVFQVQCFGSHSFLLLVSIYLMIICMHGCTATWIQMTTYRIDIITHFCLQNISSCSSYSYKSLSLKINYKNIYS